MSHDALEQFIERTRSAWGPLSTELAAGCVERLRELMRAPPEQPWLAALHREGPASRELHRDPAHGFVLLAHTEAEGQYRAPHDHGRGWVIYAVQRGAIAMGTYARVEGADGGVRLVKRDETLMRAGDVKLFLPGDIHDTRCVEGPALEFRFTERDLRHEELVERRVTRYVERDGVFTVGPA